MAATNFLILLNKYLADQLSAEEKIQFESLLKDKQNKQIFKKTVQDVYLLKTEAVTFDAQKAYEKTNSKIKRPQSALLRNIKYLTRIAALFLLGLGIHYFISQEAVSESLEPTSNVVALELADGTIYQLDKLQPDTIRNAQKDIIGIYSDGLLTYLPENTATNSDFHTLITPYGTKVNTLLADGTLVQLNAGSSMRYPSHFGNSQERNISFSGEAIFEVAKNPEKPFKIEVDQTIVEVVGTRFNLSAYANAPSIITTLEEGAVKVYAINNEATVLDLIPGEQSIWKRANQQLTKEVVNNKDYRSWTEDKLVFRNIPLTDIFKKLERKFDVTIVVKNETLELEQFTAHFDDESIEQVLAYLQLLQEFDYHIQDRTILIE